MNDKYHYSHGQLYVALSRLTNIERLFDNVEVQHPGELADLSLTLIERMTIALNRMETEEDEEDDEEDEKTTTATANACYSA
ncbi:MAG: hypothetical protein M1826_003596 [Phylliscum demangeonii]|nr:MAG: hypothetical protein M1826_003596 [Phylliscum demangeonii]